MMLCQPKVLENLPSVLVHVALSLQKHTKFLHPDHQQTTKSIPKLENQPNQL